MPEELTLEKRLGEGSTGLESLTPFKLKLAQVILIESWASRGHSAPLAIGRLAAAHV